MAKWRIDKDLDGAFGGFNPFNDDFEGWASPGEMKWKGIKKIKAELGFTPREGFYGGDLAKAMYKKAVAKAVLDNVDGVRDELKYAFLLTMDYTRERRLWNAFVKKFGKTTAKNYVKSYYEVIAMLKKRGLESGLGRVHSWNNEVVSQIAKDAVYKRLPEVVRELDIKWVSKFQENVSYYQAVYADSEVGGEIEVGVGVSRRNGGFTKGLSKQTLRHKNSDRYFKYNTTKFNYFVIYGLGTDVVIARSLPANFDDFIVEKGQLYFFVKGNSVKKKWHGAVLKSDTSYKTYIKQIVKEFKDVLNQDYYAHQKQNSGSPLAGVDIVAKTSNYPSITDLEEKERGLYGGVGLGEPITAIVLAIIALIVSIVGLLFTFKWRNEDLENAKKQKEETDAQIKTNLIAPVSTQVLTYNKRLDAFISSSKEKTLTETANKTVAEIKENIKKLEVLIVSAEKGSIVNATKITKTEVVGFYGAIETGFNELMENIYVEDNITDETNYDSSIDTTGNENNVEAGTSFFKSLTKFDYKDKGTKEIAIDVGKKLAVVLLPISIAASVWQALDNKK